MEIRARSSQQSLVFNQGSGSLHISWSDTELRGQEQHGRRTLINHVYNFDSLGLIVLLVETLFWFAALERIIASVGVTLIFDDATLPL